MFETNNYYVLLLPIITSSNGAKRIKSLVHNILLLVCKIIRFSKKPVAELGGSVLFSFKKIVLH